MLHLLTVAVAHAQSATATLPLAPGELIKNFFTFSLFAAGFLAVGAVVWGAIIYTAGAGNPGRQKEGREQITEALKGLLLLFGAVLLLRTVNPDFLNLTVLEFTRRLEYSPATPRSGLTCAFVGKEPGCGVLTAPCDKPPPNTSTCTYENLGPQECLPLTRGDASLDALRAVGCFNGHEREASGIAHAESGGDATRPSGADICTGDGAVVSWGLFQINLSIHSVGGLDCPKAFSNRYTSKPESQNCRVIDSKLYNDCVNAAKNARLNTEAACRISSGGTNWSPWGANAKCGF